MTGYVVEVEDEEEGPDEALQGPSSYDAGTAEDPGPAFIRNDFCSHAGFVDSQRPSLRKIVIAFCRYGDCIIGPAHYALQTWHKTSLASSYGRSSWSLIRGPMQSQSKGVEVEEVGYGGAKSARQNNLSRLFRNTPRV